VRTALNQEKTAAKMVADDPTRNRVDELSPAGRQTTSNWRQRLAEGCGNGATCRA
jgi:hypothetical protein